MASHLGNHYYLNNANGGSSFVRIRPELARTNKRANVLIWIAFVSPAPESDKVFANRIFHNNFLTLRNFLSRSGANPIGASVPSGPRPGSFWGGPSGTFNLSAPVVWLNGFFRLCW